jgi:hypothetical protein
MSDALSTVMIVVGILSFAGSVSVAAIAGWFVGKNNERHRIRSNYRLVTKSVWGQGETGMLVNMSQKRLVVLPGDPHPESVTVVFPDSTLVLKPSSVADSSGFLPEESVS